MNLLTKLPITIEDLYSEKKQINVHLSDKNYTFDVILKGLDNEPDCKISSWGANLWFRTLNGQNRKRYSSLKTLETAILKMVNKYVDFQGEITFSLSNDITII
jgi:hypothetical protein